MESATASETAAPASQDGPPGSAGSFEVHRPADGSTIRTLPIDSPRRVAEVTARVRAAQPEWETMGLAGRRRWLERLRDWMIQNEAHLADLMQEETGKVRAEAELEAPFLCGTINYYAEHAGEFLAEETPTPHILPLRVKRLRIVYRPYPVVGVISPWNFPLILAFDDAIPALTAGCAVVIKPSEFTPLSTMEIVRAWKDEIGGPDVLDVLNGMGETGGALVDEVDFVQFTGSDRTGKLVMKRAADTLTPVSLELVGRLADKVRGLRQGADGRSIGSDLGAMTTSAQAEIVADHVDDAREKGARVLTGGGRKDGPGDWYQPTVIADVDHSMKVMTDETFGPVIPVMKVKDADEAVRLANDSRYGLSASVFAGSSRRGEAIARRLEVGAVNVNDVLTNYFALGVPMGGWKESGIGVRHASYGIKKFVRPESIVSPRVKQGKADPLWFPYTPGKRRSIARVFRFLNARGLRNRLGL